MCQARGHLADRGQSFRLTQLLISLVHLGHILARSEQPDGLAARIGLDFTARMEHAYHTIRAYDVLVEAEGTTSAKRRFDCLLGRVAVVRMNAFQKCIERGTELVGLQTVNAVEFVGPAHGVRRHVPFPTAEACDLLRFAQLPLTLTQ